MTADDLNALGARLKCPVLSCSAKDHVQIGMCVGLFVMLSVGVPEWERDLGNG